MMTNQHEKELSELTASHKQEMERRDRAEEQRRAARKVEEMDDLERKRKEIYDRSDTLFCVHSFFSASSSSFRRLIKDGIH